MSWLERTENDETYLVLVNETGRTLNVGESIKRRYGKMSNASLLLYYSFTYEGNKFDVYEISLELKPNSMAIPDLVCLDQNKLESI